MSVVFLQTITPISTEQIYQNDVIHLISNKKKPSQSKGEKITQFSYLTLISYINPWILTFISRQTRQIYRRIKLNKMHVTKIDAFFINKTIFGTQYPMVSLLKTGRDLPLLLSQWKSHLFVFPWFFMFF